MPTQLEVLEGIKAFVEMAVQQSNPARQVVGLENEGAPPDRVPIEGRIVLRRGDPGDAQVDLNPLTYFYDHQIPLQISTVRDDARGMTAAEVAAEILGLVSAAMKADRTAGGACDYLDGTAPPFDNIYTPGAAVGCDVEAVLVASYSTTNPL